MPKGGASSRVEARGYPLDVLRVSGFADHAVRCEMTMRANGMTADVPKSAVLPARYDPESGQTWTRQRSAWVPIDLLGRAALG